MKIGEHEVTGITRDSAMVGCQKVTKTDAEAILAAMKTAADNLTLKLVPSKVREVGAVWATEVDGGIRLSCYGKTGEIAVLDLTPNGIKRFGWCTDHCGFPVESAGGVPTVVKLVQ